mmetsp:Transcript_71008/g.196590  ORF Transcript_71008/g.196590 Transcript_71008/m.196590 type:complete len:149 (+) Transcript_71008:48-494(+)
MSRCAQKLPALAHESHKPPPQHVIDAWRCSGVCKLGRCGLPCLLVLFGVHRTVCRTPQAHLSTTEAHSLALRSQGWGPPAEAKIAKRGQRRRRHHMGGDWRAHLGATEDPVDGSTPLRGLRHGANGNGRLRLGHGRFTRGAPPTSAIG